MLAVRRALSQSRKDATVKSQPIPRLLAGTGSNRNGPAVAGEGRSLGYCPAVAAGSSSGLGSAQRQDGSGAGCLATNDPDAELVEYSSRFHREKARHPP